VEEVIELHHRWQDEMGHVQGTFITPGRLSYGWLGIEGRIIGVHEPACMVTGNINVLYDATLTRDEAKERICSLAGYLAEHLGQSRIYVQFDGESLILERPGARLSSDQP
jgi:hypothetical protein